MDKAVELFVDMGRLNMAAKNLQQMAEVYEKDNDVDTAITFYQRAAEFYSTEDQTSTGNNCTLKARGDRRSLLSSVPPRLPPLSPRFRSARRPTSYASASSSLAGCRLERAAGAVQGGRRDVRGRREPLRWK